MMNRCLSLFLFCTFICSGIAVASEGARIKMMTSHVDFGVISQGEKVDHLFQFVNSGDEPLIVGQVKTSCGCTVALPSRTNLLPGEEGELKVTFDSGRFSGKIHKEIYLSSNDKNNPVAKLTLSGIVKPSLSVLPESINFGAIPQNERKTITLTITNHGSDNLVIKSVDVPAPTILVSPVATVVGKDESVQLSVSASAPGSGQRMSGYILIHTNRSQQPTLRIPTYASGASL